MEINERDYAFMLKVQEAYEKQRINTTSSIRAVANEFGLSRTKVRKILVTLGTIESPITEKALELKNKGKKLEEIADELACSMATVSTYLPYDTVIYNGEEKSLGAIRLENFRKRNKLAAARQVQRNKKREDVAQSMKERERKVLRLRMTLDIQGADMDVLQKYGKVKEGISREILVPAGITLHALHYVLQKAFGWQNSHLHHFRLPEELFSKLTNNQFSKWMDYCGLYFRFPCEDMEDLYWDDDYDESTSIKTWLRKKYTDFYQYYGISEHFMETKANLQIFAEDNRTIRVSPSFREWMRMSEDEKEELNRHPRIKKIEDVTCEEMQMYFAEEDGLDELLERLTLAELLGNEAKTTDLKQLVSAAKKRYADNTTEAPTEYAYRQKMTKLNGKVLPLTKELVYEYDYGDGWKVNIELIDAYYCDDAWDHPDKDGFILAPITDEQVYDDQTPLYRSGEITEGELREQILTVLTKRRPLCVSLDGLPVLDDVGGIGGYCEMLTGIHGKGAAHFDYDNAEETREWARMQGWTGRMNKPETLL